MLKKQQRGGFTLIEIMISMSVIVLVVVSATNLMVSIIRSNASNISTMIAYGLAQEGIEAVRNIRDSNWLLGASFQGVVGKSSSKPWGDSLPSEAGQSEYFTVDLNNMDNMNSATGSVGSAQLVYYAPWKITVIQDEDPSKADETRMYKEEYIDAGEIRYTHVSGSGAEPTPFHRYLEIIPARYSADANTTDPIKKYRVVSVVAWQEFGRERQVRIDTEITDWKKGQL